MPPKIDIAELPEFDMAEHLDSDQAIAEYLTIVLEENDPHEFAHALGTIARAKGMTEVARASGLSREELLRAHMIYFNHPGGGAVFSAGSITFCGSLPWNNFQNGISRLLENVTRRLCA